MNRPNNVPVIEIPASYAIYLPRVEEASARLRLALSMGFAGFVFCVCLGGAGSILLSDLAALRYGLVAGLAVGGLAFVVVSGAGTIHALERWAKKDFNGDGFQGQPPERIVLVNAARGVPPAPEDARRQQLIYFIKGCAVNASERRWLPDLGDLYAEFRDQLIKAGWARWKHPNAPQQGWELAATPEEIIANIRWDDMR